VKNSRTWAPLLAGPWRFYTVKNSCWIQRRFYWYEEFGTRHKICLLYSGPVCLTFDFDSRGGQGEAPWDTPRQHHCPGMLQGRGVRGLSPIPTCTHDLGAMAW